MHEKYKSEFKGISKTERFVIDELTRKGTTIVNAQNLYNLFSYTTRQAHLILSRLTKKGWLQRLAPGIYSIVPLGSESTKPLPADPWPMAMEIFNPCYLSGWTAAEHWDLTEQIYNTTIVFSAKSQRITEHKIAGLNFKIKVVPAERFFGLKKIWSDHFQIQIADMHKTMIDILDDTALGGGAIQAVEIFKAYIGKNESSIEKLCEYAITLNHGAVYKRLGFLIEKSKTNKEQWSDLLNSKINTGIINFDAHGPKKGPIISKWGIRLNIPIENIL
jgi:predicted transcriptional regulator of viral defense system